MLLNPGIFKVGNPSPWMLALTGPSTTETFPWPERPGASNNFRRSFRRSKASKLISVTLNEQTHQISCGIKKYWKIIYIKHIKQRGVLHFLQMRIPFLHQMSQSRQEISPQKMHPKKKPDGIHRAPSRILSAKSPFWNLLPRFSCCHQTPGEWERATDNVCVYISFTNWVFALSKRNTSWLLQCFANKCNISHWLHGNDLALMFQAQNNLFRKTIQGSLNWILLYPFLWKSQGFKQLHGTWLHSSAPKALPSLFGSQEADIMP